jgi:hypothetical protein
VKSDSTVAVTFCMKAALNKKTRGTTAGVIHVHAGLRVHDAGYDEADLCRCVEFAGALAAALC